MSFSLATGASQETPRQVIQTLSDRMQQVLRQNHAVLSAHPEKIYPLVDQLLIPHVDFPHLSQLTLGQHWKRATPEQQKQFVTAFKRLLVRTYAAAFLLFDHWELKFLSERHLSADKRDRRVETEVTWPGVKPVQIVYRMYDRGGKWLAYDVTIEGISLASNYRTTFASQIRKFGLDGLIARLEEQNRQRG